MRNRYNTVKKGKKHRSKFNKRSIQIDGNDLVNELNEEFDMFMQELKVIIVRLPMDGKYY